MRTDTSRTPKTRSGRRPRRNVRSRAALPGSPPGAGGRLLTLYVRPY